MNNLELALQQSDAHLNAYIIGTPLAEIRADGLAIIASRAQAEAAVESAQTVAQAEAGWEQQNAGKLAAALADQKARIVSAVQAALVNTQ
jgi:hypothetical protein